MSHHDRDAEIAAFILNKGVTRCPTACVVPTQGSPDAADQAALERHEIVREQLRRENAKLKVENDILKKAAIYFAGESK